jgi:porin-like protein
VLRAARLSVLACLLVAAIGDSARAKTKSKKDDGPVCDKAGKSDDDDDDTEGIKFKAGAACVGLSGEFDAIGQASNVHEPRLAGSNNSSSALTLKPDLRVEAALPEQWGNLKTSFETEWSYVSSTGFEQTTTLDEATVAYLGLTVGYTESLMNFWDSSNFQFTASAPNRSSHLVSYERALSAELTAAVAVEAGPSTTRGADTWRLPGTPPITHPSVQTTRGGAT